MDGAGHVSRDDRPRPRLGWRGTVYRHQTRRDDERLWRGLIVTGVVVFILAAIVVTVLLAMELPAR